ncbi:phosphate acyltransferase PlsX [bacterium]|jgi:phosphate acyltransferase|nr:phosphate acyltransferase PlsX [bacterium]
MIAVDAMGGDFAPKVIVKGAWLAAKAGVPVSLFGDKNQIVQCLLECDNQWDILPIKIIHCSEVIHMDERPVRTVMRKKESSIVKAVEAVADGRSKAVVSAGNSGATLIAGSLISGKVPGINRPAIGEFLPTCNESVFCMDLGANVDCKPEHLKEFAFMGCAYVSLVKDISFPRVALLSNGHEPYKGSTVVKDTYALLDSSDINFVGNLEPSAILGQDCTDVVVCDGFVGNVFLKSMQAVAQTMSHWLKIEHGKSVFSKAGAFINSPIYKKLKQKIDYASRGGALLLGVNHPVVISHGRSSSRAISNAIFYAFDIVKKGVVEKFKKQIKQDLGDTITIKPSVLLNKRGWEESPL